MSLSGIVKLGLLLGSALLVIAVFVFTQSTIASLSREVSSTSRVLARFCAQASFPATSNAELKGIVSDVIGNIDFPIIITDQSEMPRAWRQISVDPALVPDASIDSLQHGQPVSPVVRAAIERVRAEMKDLDRTNTPIPMLMPNVGLRLGWVHFGEPPVMKRLRWMPYASVAGVLAMLAIGLWGLAILRQSEKRTIWVGMAKETAHQLGTPISSLMGWTELLRSRSQNVPPDGEVRVPVAEMDETLVEMERDVDRLRKVAQRFSRVGSTPHLESRDITPVVSEVVHYMRKRMPQAAGEVEIRERYEPAPDVKINPELLEWVLENLISNALSALDKRPGLIEVSLAPRSGGGVEIVVRDNGRGMSPAERRRAFEPGFTTKRRGWGLGLPLARRVVEDYHRGRIVIAQSVPGRGTTVVVSLPG